MTDHGRGAAIAGVYTTDQGELTGRTHHDVLREAILGALADAEIDLAEVDGVANVRSESKSAAVSAPGLWAELLDRPLHYHHMVDVAGASHGACVAHAAAHVSAGLCDTVVVVSGWIRGSRKEIVREMAYMHGEFDASWGSLAASWFAMIAREFQRRHHVTMDHLGHVAVAARKWALHHPQALRRTPLSMEDVRAAPMIAEPLRKFDCCQTNNGAGAVVVTTPERARRTGRAPVTVLGSGECYTRRGYTDVFTALDDGGAAMSANRAWRSAGVTARDVQLFGLYDPFSFMPLLLLEQIGYCTPGEAAELAEAGELAPGGSVALNTHGGALSWGNSINSLAHVIESVRQLQGRADERQVRDPEFAVVHGFGGPLNLHSTVVLARR
ncbi:thiolase family protein [Actinophytocola sp.]|uniref:thiolase family protein n=1 Tax=Actinophytocola sp. TaxID=1872138 RepID=UPI003D6A4F5D